MKKLFFLLFFCVTSLSFSQYSKSINSYKYIVIMKSNYGSMVKTVVKTLSKSGYRVITNPKPSDLLSNPHIGLYLYIDVQCGVVCNARLKFYDYYNNLIYSSNGSNGLSGSGSVRNALKTLKSLNYKYVPLKFKKDTSYGNLKLPSSFDEAVIRDFLDTKKDLEPFEGLYRYVPKDSKISSQYKFLILKKDFTYFGFIVDANCVGCQNWKIGDVKFKMTVGAVSEILDVSCKYPIQQRKRAEKIIFTSKVSGNLLEGSNISLLKL